MDRTLFLKSFVALCIVSFASGREYCMTWSISGTDPRTGQTFSFKVSDPFRPTFCGDVPVFQEEGMDKDMKVLFYSNLDKVWQLGENLPTCGKKEITGTKVLYSSKESSMDPQKLDGLTTWYTEDKDDVSIRFTCMQRAMATGKFDNFRKVEL